MPLFVLILLFLFLGAIKYIYRRKRINKIYENAVKKHLENNEIIIQSILKKSNELQIPDSFKNEIISASIECLRSHILNKNLKCEDLLLIFAERAVTLGKKLNLIADVSAFNIALEKAKANDKLLQDLDPLEHSSSLPPLFSIPFTFKEQLLFCSSRTTCGYAHSLLLPPSTSTCLFLEILQKSGAIPFTSSNVPQALFSLETTNKIYGRAKNPWNIKRISGGSSGGEAGLVALRCNAFGIGSDAAGSIRMPSGFCGVCGLKPTQRRISIKGRLGVGRKEDNMRDSPATIGPIARNVNDLVEILKCSFGNFTRNDPEICPMKFDESLYQETLEKKKFKIGIIKSTKELESSTAVQNVIEEVAAYLKLQNHEVIDFERNPSFELSELFLTLSSSLGNIIENTLNDEYPEDHCKQLIIWKKIPNILKKAICKILDLIGEKRISKSLKATVNFDLQKFLNAANQKEILKKQFFDYWEKEGFDVLITPIFPTPAPLLQNGHKLLKGFFYNLLGSMFEMPCGVLPIRLSKENENSYETEYSDSLSKILKENVKDSHGLPISIQIICSPFMDEKCLGIMKILSQKFQLNYEDIKIN